MKSNSQKPIPQKYKSPFKRVKLEDDDYRKVEAIQQAHDDLYRHLHKKLGLANSFELSQASRYLQQSCMWYCRAFSLQNEKKEDEDGLDL